MVSVVRELKQEILTQMDFILGEHVTVFYGHGRINNSLDVEGARIISVVGCMKTVDHNIPWGSEMYDVLYPHIFLK